MGDISSSGLFWLASVSFSLGKEQPWAVRWAGGGMQRTRPSQPKRLFWMVSNIIDIQVLLNSFSFEITFGKKILRIHQRHLVWKTSCFLTDAKEVFYSDPYKRTLRTLLLRILILVWMLPVDLHMDFNIKKSWLVLLILVLVSLSQSSIVVTLIPRYVNS